MHFTKKYLVLSIVFWLMNSCYLFAQICHSFEPLGENFHQGRYKTQSADSIGLASTDNYDIVYHSLSLSIDPVVQYLQGSVVSYFKPIGSLTQIAFDLSDTLRVDSVYYRGTRLTNFTHTGNALTISFAVAISSLDSVTVYYSGAPATTGFGSFNIDKHDSIPVLWTLSEPYGSRDWWPGKMTLTDKIDSLDFYISFPAGHGYRAASNGLLIDTALQSGRVTYHWQTRYPTANYLVAMAVTNYAAYTKTVSTPQGDIQVLNYVYPEKLSDWHGADTNIASALTLYSKLFGAYPFIKEKYGHAQFNWGGGMEHQTMSFVYNSSFELINHEMAHQWFGDKLTCGSWSDIWLNEGFAVYLSALCYQYIQPQWWMAWRTSTLSNILVHANDGSVYCTDTVSVGRIFSAPLSYRKGAYILHMLRWELGDSIFFKSLYNYVNDPALTYSFSKTQLLQQHFESVSGKNLSDFFSHWFYGVGYPSYTLDWTQHDNNFAVHLSQITSDPSVSFYAMHVPVRLFGAGKDTTLVLKHDFSGQAYNFNIPFAVDSVQIDPELWLISGKNSVRKLPAFDRDNFVVVYPNPVHDQLTIWYDSKNINQLSFSIWDLQGKKVMEQSVSNQGDYSTVPLADLESGIYLLKINTEHGTSTRRILKY